MYILCEVSTTQGDGMPQMPEELCKPPAESTLPVCLCVGERPGFTVALRQSCWGCAGSAVAGFVRGGNLSHFSGDSCISESGQVAVEFCSGYQGKCFHVDWFIRLRFFLLSHQGFLWTHHRTWYILAKVEFRGFILICF